MNIKESTKEGKIKVLTWLSNYLANKSFHQMTKQDILSYLNGLKRPVLEDPTGLFAYGTGVASCPLWRGKNTGSLESPGGF